MVICESKYLRDLLFTCEKSVYMKLCESLWFASEIKIWSLLARKLYIPVRNSCRFYMREFQLIIYPWDPRVRKSFRLCSRVVSKRKPTGKCEVGRHREECTGKLFIAIHRGCISRKRHAFV